MEQNKHTPEQRKAMRNARKDEELREAFRCIVSLAYATPVGNKMPCSVYVREPGERRGDDQAEAVWSTSNRVRIYMQSWVIPFLEEHLGLDATVIKEIMERQYDERAGVVSKATGSDH